MHDEQESEAGVSRRTVLQTGAIASTLGVAGVSAFSGSAVATGCDATVDAGGGGDYTTIQGAVDDASAGDTICVQGGTYDEDVTVHTPLHLTGASDPTGPGAAVVDGGVTVTADDATVSALRIAPMTTFVAGGLDPHGILVSGATSGVTIEQNVVDGMTADSNGGSVTINGIQLWNDGPDLQTGTTVRHNVVRDLENAGRPEWPNYGGVAAIKVQGVVENTSVRGNHVERVHSAGWTYGIVTTHTGNASGVSPQDTTVEWNTIREVNDGSVHDVFADPAAAPYLGTAFAIDGDSNASEATATHNNFLETPIGAHNKDDENTLTATCNYWGHASGPANAANQSDKGARAVGDVDYTPWNTRRMGRGENAGNSCVGGKNAGRGATGDAGKGRGK